MTEKVSNMSVISCSKGAVFSVSPKWRLGQLTITGQRATPQCCVTDKQARSLGNFCLAVFMNENEQGHSKSHFQTTFVLCLSALLKVSISLNWEMSTNLVVL